MAKSIFLYPYSSRLNIGALIRRTAVHPAFIVSLGLLLTGISLTTGRFAYLLIAFVILFINVLLAGYGFSTGILWILGFSTITGFYHRLILYGSGQSPSSDYVRLVLELSILLYFVLIFSSKRKRASQLSGIRTKWLDVFVSTYLLLSTLYAFNLFYVEPLITIYGWRWVCIPIFMYYIGRVAGSKPSMVDKINKYIIVLLLLQAGYGAYQAVVGYPSFEQPWIDQLAARQITAAVEDSFFIAGKLRIPALTEGHAVVGFLIPFLFLWTIFLPGSSLSKRWQALRCLALIYSLLFLIFSNERSSIGMVGIGIGIVVFLYARKKMGIGIIFVAIPILVLIVSALSQIDPSKIPWSEDTIVLRRLLELLNPFKSGTLAGRITVYWPVYWEFFLANPIGYGLGTFHPTTATQTSVWGRSPHNMYLQVLLETGVIGLLTFVAVLVTYFKYIYNHNKRHFTAFQQGLVFSTASSFVAFLAIGVANQPIETFPLAIHFWFLMGISVSIFHSCRIRNPAH
jgi:hypothetical protein